MQYVAGDKKVRNNCVRMECVVCGSQVNLSPNLGSPVCHTEEFAELPISSLSRAIDMVHFYLTFLRGEHNILVHKVLLFIIQKLN